MKLANRLKPALYSTLAVAAAASIAAPAFAQATVEELTVTGRYGRAPESMQSLSQAVSYADLDLSTEAGRKVLRQRVNLTARYLCEKLGESSTSSGVAPSCRDAAAKDAMARAGTVEESFAPRGTGWVAPPAWVAPYPTAWTYP